MKNYIIHYTVHDKNGNFLKTGTMKVKNKLSEFDAQVKLEVHLKTQFQNFGRLTVHSCKLDNPFNDFDFKNTPFGDIFPWMK